MSGPKLIAGKAAPAPPPREYYRVRGTILPRFITAGAVTPDRGIAFEPERGERTAFAELLRVGAIRIDTGGRYWFDADAYDAAEAARSLRMVPWLIASAILIATIAMLFYRG